MLPDVSTAEPRFTLAQVIDLERPAWHLTPIGDVDHLDDGINFWCERIGRACAPRRGTLCPRGMAAQRRVPLPGLSRGVTMSADPARVGERAGALVQPDGPYSRDEVIVSGQPAASYAKAELAPGVRHFDGADFWLIYDHQQTVRSAAFAPQDGWWHKRGCACALCEVWHANAGPSRP